MEGPRYTHENDCESMPMTTFLKFMGKSTGTCRSQGHHSWILLVVWIASSPAVAIGHVLVIVGLCQNQPLPLLAVHPDYLRPQRTLVSHMAVLSNPPQPQVSPGFPRFPEDPGFALSSKNTLWSNMTWQQVAPEPSVELVIRF